VTLGGQRRYNNDCELSDRGKNSPNWRASDNGDEQPGNARRILQSKSLT